MATALRLFNRKLVCGAFLACLCVSLAGRVATAAEGTSRAIDLAPKAVVHMYPQKLSGADTLTDGPNGKRVEVTGETTLLWVDLAPNARYAHDTEYILVNARGSHVVKGQWWPVLNGKEILRGEQNASITFPVELTEK